MHMPARPERPVGSLWTVDGFEHSLVLVLVGPFAATPTEPEYLVAPLYTGDEPGFRPTDEDVALSPAETGLDRTVYAAIWNAGPALARDLLLNRGLLPDAAAREARDAYWCSLNERPMRGPRLGRPIHSRRDPVVAFQQAELARWRSLSARVYQATELPRPDAPMFAAIEAGSMRFSGADLSVLLEADPRTIRDEFGPVGSVLIQSAGAFNRVGSYVGMVSVDARLRPGLVSELREAVVLDGADPAPIPVAAANADYALAA